MMIAQHPRKSRIILEACGISASTYYWRSAAAASQPEGIRPRGRKKTLQTADIHGMLHDNSAILMIVERVLTQEFACYGYRAMAAVLRREGFIINHKKLYRMMKQAALLNAERVAPLVQRMLAKRGKVITTRPFEHLQMDIKYVFIAGEQRWAYLLTVIDVFTRCLPAQLFALSIRAKDAISLLHTHAPTWTNTQRICIRTDHGSQFIAKEMAAALKELNIQHEFTHPGVPEENAFIESWHSIFQTEVIDRYEFDSFEQAKQAIERHRIWYQHHRLHGSLKYLTPNEFSEQYHRTLKTQTLP
jgi:transposase InsO family protein